MTLRIILSRFTYNSEVVSELYVKQLKNFFQHFKYNVIICLISQKRNKLECQLQMNRYQNKTNNSVIYKKSKITCAFKLFNLTNPTNQIFISPYSN